MNTPTASSAPTGAVHCRGGEGHLAGVHSAQPDFHGEQQMSPTPTRPEGSESDRPGPEKAVSGGAADVISVGAVLYTIFALKVFEFPYAFSGLEPPVTTYTVAMYVYIEGFGKRDPIYRLGYATAIGVVLLLCVVVLVFLLRRLMRREVVQY